MTVLVMFCSCLSAIHYFSPSFLSHDCAQLDVFLIFVIRRKTQTQLPNQMVYIYTYGFELHVLILFVTDLHTNIGGNS